MEKSNISSSRVLLFLIAFVCLQFYALNGFELNNDREQDQPQIEKYKGYQVKTELVDGSAIQVSLNKDNFVEFTITGDCQIKDLKIAIEGKNFGYQRVERVVEDGRIEKNDLFAFTCYEPELLNDKSTLPLNNAFNLWRCHISPVIDHSYPLYPTLKLIAEKSGSDLPHRTVAIINRTGGESYIFYCYLEGLETSTTPPDRCSFSFEEVLEMHSKNNDSETLIDLGDKYANRFDYEKAEQAYQKALELPDSYSHDYEKLLNLYLESGQFEKAIEFLQRQIKKRSADFSLWLSLAKVYMSQQDYLHAISAAKISLQIGSERKLYKAYGVLGLTQLCLNRYEEAIKNLDQAATLAEKQCGDNALEFNRFFNKDMGSPDCQVFRLPYDLSIVYGLIAQQKYEFAQARVKNLLDHFPGNLVLSGFLAFIQAGLGSNDEALKYADLSLSGLSKKAIGTTISQGEIYPVIFSVQDNTPAYQAGLKKGDKIVAVDGIDVGLIRQDRKPAEFVAERVNQKEKVKLLINSAGSPELREVEIQVREITDERAMPVASLRKALLVPNNKIEFEALQKFLEEFFRMCVLTETNKRADRSALMIFI
ncbi:MAG: PDZ domain-containing protein [Acidobacteriota bacterium]|nr:PDZ domain-containing protein [Acidobacteriota bacterium]